MASLINLILINSDEDEKGKQVFRRLDTKEAIAPERIDVLNEKPVLLKFRYDKPFPQNVSVPVSEYKMGAEALLLGETADGGNNIQYCAASFCRIKKSKS
jgi:hypothetical protein